MHYFRFVALSLAATLFFSCLIGCHVNRDFGPPGDMNAQRTEALLHDPFPANDIGPEISGIRPRGFDLPRSEVQKLGTSPYARRGGSVPAPFQTQPNAYGNTYSGF